MAPSAPSTWRRCAGRQRCVAARAGLRARWLLDARYGCKQDATALLVEWVTTVGAAAGVAPADARVSTGALGAPESRLELELAFASMAEWEAFLARIPAAEHRAWSQRVQGMVVDGSPRWEVLRAVDVPAAAAAGAAASTAAAAGTGAASAPSIMLGGSSSGGGASSSGVSGSGGSGSRLVIADSVSPEDAALWEQAQRAVGGASSGRSGGSGGVDAGGLSSNISSDDGGGGGGGGDGGVMLDWKGDPIKFSPGDKLPFKFL